MVNCLGPFNGGFSAKFVIHDNVGSFQNVVHGFKSIVAVATTEPTGELHVQFISTDNPLWLERLERAERLERLSLPLYILRGEIHAPLGPAPPKIVR